MRESVSKPSLYRVSLGIGTSRSTNEYLELFCSRVAVPSRRLNTTMSLGHEQIGVVREMPTQMIYSKPLSLTVIEPRDFSVYTDISNWTDSIVQGSNIASSNRHLNFQNTYAFDIHIDKLELPAESGVIERVTGNYEVVKSWIFHDAYPITIGAISLASDDTDNFVRWNVDFTYTTYTQSSPRIESITSSVLNSIVGGLF